MNKEAEMSDQSLQDYALTDSDIEELLKTVRGSLIIHIRPAEREDGVLREHSPMAFHLHALIMEDKENETISVFCLDTSDMVAGKGPLSIYRDLAFSLGETFVEKLNSIMSAYGKLGQDPERDALFVHAHEAFWEKYSQIKEESYLAKLMSFAAYMFTSKFEATREPLEEAPQEWKSTMWAEVRTAEERLLA